MNIQKEHWGNKALKERSKQINRTCTCSHTRGGFFVGIRKKGKTRGLSNVPNATIETKSNKAV